MKRAILIVLIVSALCVADRAFAQSVRSRAVSLAMLQEALRSPNAAGVMPRDLLELCGLTRIEGYTLDRANHDLIVFGKVDPTAPPLHTEDLVIALRAAWLRYAYKEGRVRYYSHPGCSIDPDPAVVRRLSEIGQQIGGTSASGEIENLLKQWCEVSKQPQQVRVRGVPFSSHFAALMVQADYDLKRLVDGSVTLQTPGVTSLVEMMMAAAQDDLAHGRPLSGPASSMSRFWFYPGEGKYGLDGDTVTILQAPVVLLTEEEYLAEGGVAGKGRPEANARRFAEGFTAHYAAIAREKPIYQELEGLFRCYVLAQLLRHQNVRVDLHYLLDRFPVPQAETPKQVPGVCRIRRFEQTEETADGTHTSYLWMPSCGGVSMDVKIGPRDFVKTKRPASLRRGGAVSGRTAPKHAAVKSRPSSRSLYWDY